MKFVTVRDLRGKPGAVWRELAREKELVLTSSGKPIAILSSVGESSLEDSLRLLRRARSVQAVSDLQQRALRGFPRGLPDAAVGAEIAAVRKKRRR
jgi:antitoxin (DNA-binding transcriptional repressor) of toxin-antitoxin stability system